MNRIKLFSLIAMLMVINACTMVVSAQKVNHSIHDESVKIGLLVPNKNTLSARNAAELAIKKANRNGGCFGKSFQLVVRSAEGPWGTGSKESVSLVFKDKVLAILGSLDGRNAHLAEQVATKTRITFISTWATDMTLSYAFVPWYFRCIPDDEKQANLLIQEIYNNRKFNNVALIGEEGYDSRNAVKAFNKVVKSMGISEPRQFLYEASGHNFNEILQEIKNSGVEAIVLFGKPILASDIIPLLRQQEMTQAVFGTISILDDQNAHTPDWNILENVITVSSEQWFTKNGLAFQKAFQNEYGYQPGPVAAYAYDGMNLIINAIKKAGLDRDKIIDVMSKTNYKNGVTGKIRFDDNGNRTGNFGLMQFRSGKPYPIDED